MGWTGNHSRRKNTATPSTSARTASMTGVSCRRAAAINVTDHLAGHALVRRPRPGQHAHHDCRCMERGAGHMMGHHGREATRASNAPAGTIETGATTAYDPIIGAVAGPLDL